MAAAHLRGPPVEVEPAPYQPGCSGKIGLDRAQAAMIASKRNGWAYACPHCDGWHTSRRELPPPPSVRRGLVRAPEP